MAANAGRSVARKAGARRPSDLLPVPSVPSLCFEKIYRFLDAVRAARMAVKFAWPRQTQ
jgi:hypothetical protein